MTREMRQLAAAILKRNLSVPRERGEMLSDFTFDSSRILGKSCESSGSLVLDGMRTRVE